MIIRNPKEDPVAGDRITFSGRATVTVDDVHPQLGVLYHDLTFGVRGWVRLPMWRALVSCGTVTQRGDQPAVAP